MREDELVKLTKWIVETPSFPVFSILVSRNGKLVYELYTSGIVRDDAHYMMSVTKSVLSTLIGIAAEHGKLARPESSIVDMLPASVFASDAERERLRPLTLMRVMGMSGLDAPDPPRDSSAEATARCRPSGAAPNRLVAALRAPVLAEGFQYNDSTPTLAVGALEYAVHETALEFAEQALFGPLRFRNYEWMHEDAAGIDNAGYGLRLRPVDMQKLGIVFLDHGAFEGKEVVPRAWVERSFQAWNKSKPDKPAPDYGWFWWHYDFGPRWSALVANGWKGQRIAVFPDQRIVLTRPRASRRRVRSTRSSLELVTKVLKPSVENGANQTHDPGLDDLVRRAQSGPSRFSDFIQFRMVPSKAPKAYPSRVSTVMRFHL